MRTYPIFAAALATTVSAVTLDLEADSSTEASFDLDGYFDDFFESLESPTTYTPPSAV